jgi:hypothetical protein
VVSLGDTSAALISATPNAGFTVQTWNTDGLLRVDFTSPDHVSELYVTWNGHPPSAQTVEQ